MLSSARRQDRAIASHTLSQRQAFRSPDDATHDRNISEYPRRVLANYKTLAKPRRKQHHDFNLVESYRNRRYFEGKTESKITRGRGLNCSQRLNLPDNFSRKPTQTVHSSYLSGCVIAANVHIFPSPGSDKIRRREAYDLLLKLHYSPHGTN
jgi:hypothetical protein